MPGESGRGPVVAEALNGRYRAAADAQLCPTTTNPFGWLAK